MSFLYILGSSTTSVLNLFPIFLLLTISEKIKACNTTGDALSAWVIKLKIESYVIAYFDSLLFLHVYKSHMKLIIF